MSFERNIFGQIPMHEAASFFIKLKTAADPMVPMAPGAPAAAASPGADPHAAPGPAPQAAAPDVTGAVEGQFAAPLEQVIATMTDILHDEFKAMLAYHVYAQSLRDLSHDSIAEHFEEHAEKELEHADFLMKRMAVLQGPVQVPDIQAPPASTDATEIIQTLIGFEQEAIQKWEQLRGMVGENPTKFTIEQYLQDEQEHLDDLWQLLPHQPDAAPAPVVEAPKTAEEKTAVSREFLSRAERAATAGARDAGEMWRAAGRMEPPEHQFAEKMLAKSDRLENLTRKLREKLAAQFSTEEEAAAKDNARQRARISLAGRHELSRQSRGGGWGRTLGRVGGAVAGGAAAHKAGGNPLATIAGAALGSSLGGAVGGSAGHELDLSKDRAKTAEDFRAGLKKLALENPNATQEYLAQEQGAQQAEEQNSSEYFKQKMQMAMQQLQEQQAASQGSQEQMAQLQQQNEASQAQIQAAQQQALISQQAAMQNVQSSHAAATQAMQQAVSAKDESLQSQQLAANMRMSYQQMRGDVMNAASKDIAPDVAGALASQQASPTSGPQPVEGPAGQAPQAAGAPGAAPPEGENAANNAPATGTDAPVQSATPASQTGTVEGTPGVQPGEQGGVGTAKQAGMAANLGQKALERLPYAVGGAAVGGGLTALESKMDSSGLRNKIQKLESNEQRGFGQSLDLAQAKMHLALHEIAEKHPVPATIAGSLVGASTGMGLGRPLVHAVREAVAK